VLDAMRHKSPDGDDEIQQADKRCSEGRVEEADSPFLVSCQPGFFLLMMRGGYLERIDGRILGALH
jgi:hypothetical protein